MPLDRPAILDRFTRTRARTRALFELLHDAAYYERPIALRNPVVFYEGHLPAFAVNTLVKKALGQAGVDEQLETIFARGIDPESEAAAVARGNPACCTGRRRSGRFSSTRRCTRRRWRTCGTSCRMPGKRSPRTT
jgi:hypothetical protein